MGSDEKTNTDDTEELHGVQLEPRRHLAADDVEGTKTFHMAPRQDELGWPDGSGGRDHWPVYDPFTGLRTAAVLGGLMLLMLVYILYKTRCGGRVGRRRWTSKDRLFVERYKRKVQERCTLDGGSQRYRRRETIRGTSTSRNVNTPVPDKQVTVVAASDRRQPGQIDAERRHRRRHHSVNEAITHLDVRIPLRVGQDVARPVQGAPDPASPATGSRPAVEVDPENLPPTPAVVEDRPAVAEQPDRDHHPPPPARIVDLTAGRTSAAHDSALVGVDLRRLGRRCRSLENVHAAAADHRTYALLMITN